MQKADFITILRQTYVQMYVKYGCIGNVNWTRKPMTNISQTHIGRH